MQNILRYLTPEILAWESGNIQEVRPLGSVLCLPDGREWYAFGFTRDAYYGSLSLLMASSRRVRRMGAGQQSGGYPLRRAAVSY